MTDCVEITDEMTVKAIKELMKYTDGTECCKICVYFGKFEMGGNPTDRPSRCERNGMWFPVSEHGYCREFTLEESR